MSSPKTLSINSTPTTGSAGAAGAGNSRGSSPDGEGNILVHSMESLVISDSSVSDDCATGEVSLSLGLDQQNASEDADDNSLNILGGGDEEDPHLEHSTVPILEVDQEEDKAVSKGKKRRISSRRQRKISLKASDKDVFRIAGVEIEVIKQGFLLQHGSFQRWNKRYFTVTEDKLYVSKNQDEKLREEIILKDVTIAENSSKNVNHSFTILTPFQQEVVLAASSRKEMEEWVSAFKLAASKSKHAAVLEALQHLEGQHSWFACTHSRPTYCNVCRDALHGVAWHGLSCEVCKFKSHRRCVFRAEQGCKWTTRSSLQEAGIYLDKDFSIPHQWLEGNIPAGSKCSVCERTCGSMRRLQDYRCMWCKYTVHNECRDKMDKVCTLGEHCLSILPPTALQRSDAIRKGMWEPYQVYGHSPVLACANSKSGNNLGVKFLRRLKYWLNPAQVFDLAITGPDLGLQLFHKFEKFRIIVLGGDGSIGWVLSTVDKYNLHSKCMIGVVPLGTGNDLARVLGWGAQCSEEEKLPSILSEMEHSSFKLLDRWSLQYTPDFGVDLSTMMIRSSSPPKGRFSLADTSSFDRPHHTHHPSLPPFPAPKKTLSTGAEDPLSPADSVFAHQDSASSEEYRSAPEHTPSPDRYLSSESSIPGSGAPPSHQQPGGMRLSDSPPQGQGGQGLERASSGGSQQSTEKISAFHKSLSGLAHTFSSILISEDEKEVLQSAEILGGVVSDFLGSVLEDMESEMQEAVASQNAPLVQKCVVLQDKLNNLIHQYRVKHEALPPEEKKFVKREALMARANSLKKAITSVIDVTGKVLDTHAEELDEIRQLTSEISALKSPTSCKTLGTAVSRQPKDSVSSISSVVDPVPLLPEMKEVAVMNNYFGLGLDAKITYKFNETREKNPAQYKSRTKNMMLYSLLGGKEFLTNSQRYLERRIKLECDGEAVELPQRLQGLVFLNIPSYMAGTNFWGTEREKDGFCAPSHDDKLLEVVAVSGLTSIATAKVLGIQNHRLKQCRIAKVTLSEELPIQVDGEAWLQKPGTIVVSHKNKARMLVKDKAFSQTLESWKQKQSTTHLNIPPAPVTSTLQQALSKEELQRYRELAAAVPPLMSYIKTEASTNSDILRDLVPYVTSASHSLDRIFLEGGLVSDTADVFHLQDFERDLKALIQETLWFLNMHRISPEREEPLREAVKTVEGHMRRLLSTNLSACSQAHHMFRRGSDTLLLTTSTQHQQQQQSSPNLARIAHRDRSAQLVPDDTIQAIAMIRKIGKEVELWDEDDVRQWLEGIGMAEYTSNFIQRNIVGRDLIRLRRVDLQEMGITKVSHTTRLFRALQALNSDTSECNLKTPRPSIATVHRMQHYH